jgi:hypothetical protein
VVEITVAKPASRLIKELLRRGLVIKLETIEKRRSARHWHMGFQGRPGVLEITDLGDRSELKVASNRDGGWATAFVRELAKRR